MDHAAHTSSSLFEVFSQSGFMPHGHCYLWKPMLVFLHVASDSLIGLSYVAISLLLYLIVKKINLQFNKVLVCFGVFIAACGVTHFMEIWNLWNADYWISAFIKVITALSSVAAAIYLFKNRKAIISFAEAKRISDQRRTDLEELTQKLELQIKELHEQKIHSRNLQLSIQERDEFISIASHELKTPLTSMKLQIDLTRSIMKKNNFQEVDPGKIQKMFEVTERQIERMIRLIEDMLDASRVSVGKLNLTRNKMNLNDLIHLVLERHTPQLESTNNKVSFTASEIVIGNWDHFRLEQVMSNLLSNSMKYAAGSNIEITLVKSGNKAELKIKDFGMGISKEMHHKIFNRFERAIPSNNISGLGLGLYITHEILYRHGGTIRVESELNQGATFIIELPIEDIHGPGET